MSKPLGDSGEQKAAEGWLVSSLASKLGVTLKKERFTLEGGSWIEVDGYCQAPKVFCEAWAHVGAPKSAQKGGGAMSVDEHLQVCLRPGAHYSCPKKLLKPGWQVTAAKPSLPTSSHVSGNHGHSGSVGVFALQRKGCLPLIFGGSNVWCLRLWWASFGFSEKEQTAQPDEEHRNDREGRTARYEIGLP